MIQKLLTGAKLLPKAKPRRKNKPLLFAHRGGNLAGADKENTLAAFRASVLAGINHIETDVILSRDGEVVVYHGSANLLKQTQTGLIKRSKVQALSYSQIRSLIKPGGESVPLMKDVLNELPKVFFSVDAKTDEVVRPLLNLVKSLKAEDRVSITSFNLNRSKKIAQSLGDGATVGICIDRHQARVFQLRSRSNFERLKKSGIKVVHFPHSYINKRLVELAHQNDLRIWAWTVNKSSDMKKMAELEVDGIISDEVKMLKTTISVDDNSTTRIVDKQMRNT